FVLSSALAGLGGILIAPITFAWAYMGTTPGIKAFAAAIFGGLENTDGILVGGLVIGLLEQLFGIVNSNFKEGVTFLFILIVLAISPTGLMGRREISKVCYAAPHFRLFRPGQLGAGRAGCTGAGAAADHLRRPIFHPGDAVAGVSVHR